MNNRKKQAMSTRRKLLYTAYQIIRDEGYPALTIRKLCEKSGVSTGAFYHHYSSKEDLITQGFMSFDEKLEEELSDTNEKNPLLNIKYILMSLTKYVYDNGSGFAKEVYISQFAITDSFITREDRVFNRAVMENVQKAQNAKLLSEQIAAKELSDLLIRINRGCILDWCLHDFSYDLIKQTEKDLDLILDYYKV